MTSEQQAAGGSVALVNIGTLVTGDFRRPIDTEHDAIVIEAGIIRELTTTRDVGADIGVIDVGGATVTPGLIDAHSHPVVAGFNPRLGLYDWVEYYRRAGVMGFISAGAVHFPGFHGDDADMSVAIAKASTASYNLLNGPGKPLVDAACLLATKDMLPRHVSEANEGGIKRLKFLYEVEPERRVELADAARELGWISMLHCGGPATVGVGALEFDEIMSFRPDVLLHLNGGPTALPDDTLAHLMDETDMMIDLVKFGNPSHAVRMAQVLAERGQLHRLMLGTDSPTMSGINPSGLWYLIAMISSLGGLPPETLIATASGSVAAYYWKEARHIEVGHRGSVLAIDAPRGGSTTSALETLAHGDLPGMGIAVIDGVPQVGMTNNIPPAQRPVQLRGVA